MTKGWVTNIMAKSNGLNQVFIEIEEPANGPGDAGNKLDMQNSVGDMIV